MKQIDVPCTKECTFLTVTKKGISHPYYTAPNDTRTIQINTFMKIYNHVYLRKRTPLPKAVTNAKYYIGLHPKNKDWIQIGCKVFTRTDLKNVYNAIQKLN